MVAFREWDKYSADVRAQLAVSEDFLTARTFGLLRYCTAHVLFDILRALGVPAPAHDAVEIELWPRYAHSPPEIADVVQISLCEPDAVLLANGFACLVEAKFLGSRLGEYRSQLGREWLVASKLATERNWTGPRLMLVTNDGRVPSVPGWDDGRPTTPASQIAGFVCDMARRGVPVTPVDADVVAGTLTWTSWATLAEVVSAVRNRVDGVDARVLEEVYEVLQVLGCTRFTGWRGEHLSSMDLVPTSRSVLERGRVNRFGFEGMRQIADEPNASVLGRS